jgi:sodium transport system permease protein
MRPTLWMAAVPLFGQQITILRVLRGEAVSALAIGLGVTVTLVAAAAIFWLTLRLYRSERLAISA